MRRCSLRACAVQWKSQWLQASFTSCLLLQGSIKSLFHFIYLHKMKLCISYQCHKKFSQHYIRLNYSLKGARTQAETVGLSPVSHDCLRNYYMFQFIFFRTLTCSHLISKVVLVICQNYIFGIRKFFKKNNLNWQIYHRAISFPPFKPQRLRLVSQTCS